MFTFFFQNVESRGEIAFVKRARRTVKQYVLQNLTKLLRVKYAAYRKFLRVNPSYRPTVPYTYRNLLPDIPATSSSDPFYTSVKYIG